MFVLCAVCWRVWGLEGSAGVYMEGVSVPRLFCVQSAGGLGDGLGVRECAWKESQEEASIDEELLEDLKSVGIIRCVLELVELA